MKQCRGNGWWVRCTELQAREQACWGNYSLMGSFGRQLPGVNVVWRDEVRLKWNFWLENVFKWKGSRQTSCALMGWEVDWGNWNAGFHSHTDGREAWTLTRMYTGAGKCTRACSHRCFYTLSPLYSFDQARARSSGLTRAPQFHFSCWTLVCFTHRRAWRCFFSFVLIHLRYRFLHWEHPLAGHQIGSKAVFFKRYSERRVRENCKRHLRERG